MAGVFTGFGKAAAQLGLELLPLAAVVALIGAGIGLAGLGIGYLADKFRAFMNDLDFKKVLQLGGAINVLAASLYNLAASLLLVSATGITAVPVLWAINKVQDTNKTEAVATNTKEETKNIELTVNVHIDSPVLLDGKKVGQFVSEAVNKQNIKLIPGRLYVATDIKTS